MNAYFWNRLSRINARSVCLGVCLTALSAALVCAGLLYESQTVSPPGIQQVDVPPITRELTPVWPARTEHPENPFTSDYLDNLTLLARQKPVEEPVVPIPEPPEPPPPAPPPEPEPPKILVTLEWVGTVSLTDGTTVASVQESVDQKTQTVFVKAGDEIGEFKVLEIHPPSFRLQKKGEKPLELMLKTPVTFEK